MASAHGGHSGGLRISTSAEAGAASSAIASANQLAFNVTKSDVGTWTGGDVWESAVCLAQYLRGIGLDWGATRVVELGAGAGLVGLTAAACGAREVVLTDQVLHLAAHNANQNFSGAARERVQLQELRWGDADMTASVCGGGDGFDLIVASDVIYYNEHYDALAETLAALSKPGTLMLLCNPGGSPTNAEAADHAVFFDKLRAFGYVCEDISTDACIPPGASTDRGPICLARATLPPTAQNPQQQALARMHARSELRTNPLAVPALRANRDYAALEVVDVDACCASASPRITIWARSEEVFGPVQPEEPEYCHPALHRATKAVIESAGGQRQAACAWQDAARGELWTADGEDWLDLHATWEDQEASDDGSCSESEEEEDGELEAVDAARARAEIARIYRVHRPDIGEQKLDAIIKKNSVDVLIEMVTLKYVHPKADERRAGTQALRRRRLWRAQLAGFAAAPAEMRADIVLLIPLNILSLNETAGESDAITRERSMFAWCVKYDPLTSAPPEVKRHLQPWATLPIDLRLRPFPP